MYEEEDGRTLEEEILAMTKELGLDRQISEGVKHLEDMLLKIQGNYTHLGRAVVVVLIVVVTVLLILVVVKIGVAVVLFLICPNTRTVREKAEHIRLTIQNKFSNLRN